MTDYYHHSCCKIITIPLRQFSSPRPDGPATKKARVVAGRPSPARLIDVPAKGSCLFEAIALGLAGDDRSKMRDPAHVRATICSYEQEHEEEFAPFWNGEKPERNELKFPKGAKFKRGYVKALKKNGRDRCRHPVL